MSLSNENASSRTGEELPRLSITYLLLATAAIAADLGLSKALADENPSFPNQWLLYLSWGTGSIVTALGVQLLIWEGIRRLQSKPSLLVEPGAKYAAVMGWLGIVSLTYFLSFRFIGWQSAPAFGVFLSLSMLFECTSLGIALLGIYFIRSFAWRALLACHAVMCYRSLVQSFPHLAGGSSGFDLYNMLSRGSLVLVAGLFVLGFIALAVSIIQDLKSGRQRHWTHYLGAVLFCMSLISATSSYVWEFLMNGW